MDYRNAAPDAPESLPAYVGDILRDHATDDDVLAAIEVYAAELREWDAPVDPDEVDLSGVGGSGKVVDTRTKEGWTDVIKKVKCGKEACACATSDDALHGPYHYRVRRNGDDIEWEYVPLAESDILG